MDRCGCRWRTRMVGKEKRRTSNVELPTSNFRGVGEYDSSNESDEIRHWYFVIHSSLGIRHRAFVIRHFLCGCKCRTRVRRRGRRLRLRLRLRLSAKLRHSSLHIRHSSFIPCSSPVHIVLTPFPLIRAKRIRPLNARSAVSF